MSFSFSLRRGGPGDEVALSLVGQASFLEAFAGTLLASDLLAHCTRQHAVEKYRDWLADGYTRIWLAEVEPGNGPVGYLVLTKPDLPLDDVGPHDWEVKRIYLLHRFQGAGLGARLMGEARSWAEKIGATRLLLGVYAKNQTAISFYERLGYRKAGTRRFQVGANLYDDLILALPLTPK